MAEVVAPIRDMLEERLKGNVRRTKRIAANRKMAKESWTPVRACAWLAAQDLFAKVVALSHAREDMCVLIYPDAFDKFYGSVLTQVPVFEFDSGTAVEDMSHEPLGFISGVYRGSQL